MVRYITALILCAALVAGCHNDAPANDTTRTTTSKVAPIDTLPTLILQVQQCSRLYTAEYNIHKIVLYDDVKSIKGNLLNNDFEIPLTVGDRKIAIPIDARLKAYIDFSHFSEQNIERQNGKLTIILPDPVVVMTGSKVDHAHVKQYVGMMRQHFSQAEMNNLEAQGRQAIMATIPQLGILATAREHAARLLIPLAMQLGYQEKDITISFKKELNEQQLQVVTERPVTTQTPKR